MADDWDALPDVTPAAHVADAWDALPDAGAAAPPGPGFFASIRDHVAPVMRAFGQGWEEGFGPERLGMPPEDVKWLSKAGIYAPEGAKGYDNPFHAMNELLGETIYKTGQYIFRGGAGAFRSAQAGVKEGLEQAGVSPGLARDVVAMPEAFFGSPHPTGIPRGLPEVPFVRLPSRDAPVEIAPPAEGFTRFYHGGGDYEGGPRWLTPDPNYAAGYAAKSADTGRVYYVDIPNDSPFLVKEFDDTGTSAKAPFVHFEAPEEIAKELKPFGEVASLTTARQLGVIGPEAPRLADAPPREAAARAVTPPDDILRGPEVGGGEPPASGNPWQDRFDKFVGKLNTGEDVQSLIRDAARDNDGFQEARAGDVPLGHVESLAEAAGVAADTVDPRGIGRVMKNDAEVRVGMQLMLQATENVRDAARELRAADTPENAIKFQEAMMRRDLAVEQIVGLRAEWGRTGGVFQEFLRDVKDQETLDTFLKDKGRTPGDLRDIADALDKLDGTGAARVLSDMHSKRPSVFYWTWVNGLISGLLTHTKYVAANALYTAHEHGVVTPIAAIIGKAKQLARGTGLLMETAIDAVEISKERSARQAAAIEKMSSETRAKFGSLSQEKGSILSSSDQNKYSPAQEARLKEIDAELDRLIKVAGYEEPARTKMVRQSDEVDRVFFGEAPAGIYGLIGAVPDAIFATGKSVWEGKRAVLKSEIELHREAVARGEKVPPVIDRAVNQISGAGRPEFFGDNSNVWGRLTAGDVGGAAKDATGRALGAPGDMAMGIHSFFKVLGERAGIRTRNYRAAVNEGLSPAEGDFWRRFGELNENPSMATREGAVADAYKGTFMGELGPHGRAWQKFTKETPGLKWLFPFSHIPVNLIKATYEATPLALLDSEMRASITGKNGGVAQDRAIARMVAGSAIMGYFVHQAMNGRAVGDYPHDPQERDQWKLQGKQPNSVLIGGYWVSFNKFGPAGNLANLGANIAAVIQHLEHKDDDAMSKATFHAASAAAHLVVDEVGFQSLQNLFEAYHDDKKGAAWAASTAASFLPYSSFLGQTASYMDPHMREARSFIDGIKNKIPGQRETLLAKRDWLGDPVPNPQYGNIIRQRQALTDPLSMEMDRLQIHPGLPADRIGGVKLPRPLYDEFQTIAGAYTKTALESLVNAPGWTDLPTSVRISAIHANIKSSRQGAESMMQVKHPELIGLGIQQRVDFITGKSLTARPKSAPQPFVYGDMNQLDFLGQVDPGMAERVVRNIQNAEPSPNIEDRREYDPTLHPAEVVGINTPYDWQWPKAGKLKAEDLKRSKQ